ncbi:minor tail protein [Arthrobacter phage vB_ArS-ArV2]|uniref:Tail protein n=1 Tax=Arthrobacter phage vB_ArS-ArV2 TaxID=1414742 RepID=V5R8Z5_9CAUD|nr:minor tail protein [Arthrobacter phage vB_ArS-ArV2]AHB31628.1 tail protein [Arthrobacter phage vB_ArS-ArV2]
MASEIPYEILVYRGWEFIGWVGRPLDAVVTPRHNQKPTATFQVDADHLRVSDLKEPGARVDIYRHGQFEMSGPVRAMDGSLVVDGAVTFSVEGDFRILHNWKAWPKPGAALTGQDVEYRTITGPAETVVKTVMAENAARLGFPLTVAPDQGRGAVGTYTFRMHAPYDRLFPAVDQAGIGVTVRHSGNGLLLDCYTPRDYPHRLSPAKGNVIGGKYTLAAPSATRVVVGGQGEGVAREFRQFTDPAREADWNDIIEEFRDARDSSSGDVFAARAAETLAEGAPMAGLSLELSETKHFRYGGDGLRVGDRVTAEVNGQTYTDVLREVRLTWNRDGDQAAPIIGERTDDPDVQLAKSIRALRRDNMDRMAR